jgi:hypothetical protein
MNLKEGVNPSYLQGRCHFVLPEDGSGATSEFSLIFYQGNEQHSHKHFS